MYNLTLYHSELRIYGERDPAFQECVQELHDLLRDKQSFSFRPLLFCCTFIFLFKKTPTFTL